MNYQDIYYAVAHRDQEHIDSFKDRYDQFDTDDIHDIFKSDLNLTVTNIKPSDSWGSSHVIYFVDTKENNEPLVFRANNGYGEPEYVMEIEKHITDRVLESGLNTNKILHVDISRKTYSYDYQIQEMLKGKDPEIHFNGTQEEYDTISFQLGQYIAKLSDVTYEKFGRFDPKSLQSSELFGLNNNFSDYIFLCLDYDLELLESSDILAKKSVKNIYATFQDNKKLLDIKTGSLVHHDLADHNLTFDQDGLVAVFDWEAAVIGDPVLDLASCPTWGTIYPREEKLIEGYTSIKSLPDNFVEKRDLYKLRTILWKTVYCARANILTPARAQRLQDALAPFGIS